MITFRQAALRLFQGYVRERITGHADTSNPISLKADYLDFLRKSRIDSLLYRSSDVHQSDQESYNKIWDTQLHHLLIVNEALSTVRVSPVWYKGAAVILGSGSGFVMSTMADMDLLVPPASVHVVKGVLTELGFVQGEYDIDSDQLVAVDHKIVASYEENNYELFAFTKVVRPENLVNASGRVSNDVPFWRGSRGDRLFITFDVHTSVSKDLPSDLGREDYVMDRSGALRLVSPTNLFWIIALRYYSEIVSGEIEFRSREIFYLIDIIFTGQVDFDKVIRLTERFNVRPAIYYTLKFLEYIGVDFEGKVDFARIDPRMGSRKFDFGPQYSKIFGLLDTLELNCSQLLGCS